MRRIIIVALSAVLLTTTAWLVRSGAAGSTDRSARPAAAPAAAPEAAVAEAHHVASSTGDAGRLAEQLAAARLATVRYATSLDAAKKAGYQIITRMIPDMGYHYRNPTIQGFDVRKPPILVYEHHGRAWQLGALEWVFPSTPTNPPLPGATYGSFSAACHYTDGTFVFASSQDQCAKRGPDTRAPFSFWHPDLVTLHVWLWYPNPAGLYSGTNPYIRPFNETTTAHPRSFKRE